MRTEREILDYLSGVIEQITLGKVRPADVREESILIDEIGLDSLDYASALLQCEQWLGIRIREDGVNWRDLRTAGQLARFLRLQQKRSQA